MLNTKTFETDIELTKKSIFTSKKINFKKTFKGLILVTAMVTLSAGAMFANIGYKTGQVYEYNNKYFSKITNYSEMKKEYSSFIYTDEQYKKDIQFFSYFFSENFPTTYLKKPTEKNKFPISYTYSSNSLNSIVLSYINNRGDYKPTSSIINKFNINKDLDKDSYITYLMESSALGRSNDRIYKKTLETENTTQYREYKKLMTSTVYSSKNESKFVSAPGVEFNISFTSDNIIENYNQLLKDNNVPLSFLNMETINQNQLKFKQEYKFYPDNDGTDKKAKEAIMNIDRKYNSNFINFRERWNNNTLSEKEKYDFLKTIAFINNLYSNSAPHISSWSNKIYTPSDFLTEFWNNYYNKKYNMIKEEIFYL